MKIYNVNGSIVGLKDLAYGASQALVDRHSTLLALGFKVVGWL